MGYSVSNKSSNKSFYEDYKSRQHGSSILNLNSDSFKVNTDTNNENNIQYFDNSATQNSVEVEELNSLSTNDMGDNLDILKKTLDETKAQLEKEIKDLEKELGRNEDLYSGGDPRFKRQAPANPELTEKINEKKAELNQINSYSYQIEQQIKIQPYEEKRQTEDFQNFLNNYSSDYQGIDWGLMESTGYDVNLYCMEIARGKSSEEREQLIAEGKNQIDTVAMVEYLLSRTDTTAEDFNPKLYLGPGLQDAYDLYQYMSQEQREMYHYVFKTEGEEAANSYIEVIQDSINQAKGAKEAEDFINNLDLNNQEELEKSLMNFLKVSKGGLRDGILNFFAGIENAFKDNKVLSSDEYKTMIVLQYLAEHSKFYDEIYEGSSSIGNMLPAITASVVVSLLATPAAGDVVGNVLMGVSAGGNAKHQARVNGSDVVSSTIYGILNGSSEALLGHFLGNIPGLNKESTSALIGLFKEGVEEFSQEWVDAALRGTILHEDIDWSTVKDQSMKAFVMGAIVSGIMNGSVVTIPVNGVNTVININDVINYCNNNPNMSIVDAFNIVVKGKTGQSSVNVNENTNLDQQQGRDTNVEKVNTKSNTSEEITFNSDQEIVEYFGDPDMFLQKLFNEKLKESGLSFEERQRLIDEYCYQGRYEINGDGKYDFVDGNYSREAMLEFLNLSSEEAEIYNILVENYDNTVEGQWVQKLTEEEKAALRNYTARMGFDLNSTIRTGYTRDGMEVDYSKEIDLIDSAIEKQRGMIKDTIKVYRGLSLDAFAAYGINSEADLKNLIGQVYTDEAFMSCSALKSNARSAFSDSIVMEIDVPPGSNGAYIEQFNACETKYGQTEFLLGRNTQLAIKDVVVENGRVVIKAEVIVDQNVNETRTEQVQIEQEANKKNNFSMKNKITNLGMKVFNNSFISNLMINPMTPEILRNPTTFLSMYGLSYSLDLLQAKRATTNVLNSDFISSKIAENGIVHITTEQAADSIISSGILKAADSKMKAITNQGVKTYFFTGGNLDFDDVCVNVNPSPTLVGVKIKPNDSQMNSLGYRYLDDNALIYNGDFDVANSNSVEKVYYGLKLNEETNQLYYEEITKSEYDNYSLDFSNTKIKLLQNNFTNKLVQLQSELNIRRRNLYESTNQTNNVDLTQNLDNNVIETLDLNENIDTEILDATESTITEQDSVQVQNIDVNDNNNTEILDIAENITEQDTINSNDESVYSKDVSEFDERINNSKNRVFENTLALGKNNPIAMSTSNTSIYRVTGLNQIEDIINCGYVRPKAGKLKGGHENEIFWTRGGEKTFYYDKRPVLEVHGDKLKDGQMGAVSIEDLSGIWIFDESQNKYINQLNYFKDLYKQRHLNNVSDLNENIINLNPNNEVNNINPETEVLNIDTNDVTSTSDEIEIPKLATETTKANQEIESIILNSDEKVLLNFMMNKGTEQLEQIDFSTLSKESLVSLYQYCCDSSRDRVWFIGNIKKIVDNNNYEIVCKDILSELNDEKARYTFINGLDDTAFKAELIATYLDGENIKELLYGSYFWKYIKDVDNNDLKKVLLEKVEDYKRTIQEISKKNVVNIKDEVNELKQQMVGKGITDDLSIARAVYMLLGQELSYSEVGRKTTTLKYAENINQDSLSNVDRNVVCWTWSALYREALISAGINPNDIKVIKYSDHNNVCFKANNHYFIADATYGYEFKATTDLVATKVGAATHGFFEINSDLGEKLFREADNKVYDSGNYEYFPNVYRKGKIDSSMLYETDVKLGITSHESSRLEIDNLRKDLISNMEGYTVNLNSNEIMDILLTILDTSDFNGHEIFQIFYSIVPTKMNDNIKLAQFESAVDKDYCYSLLSINQDGVVKYYLKSDYGNFELVDDLDATFDKLQIYKDTMKGEKF